jgi:hypothetical protein
MRTTRGRFLMRASVVAALVVVAVTLTVTAAVAAVAMHGTFTTPTTQGTITYTPLRAIRGGSEGRFLIDGKRFPGSLYAATTGGTGLVWYYGTSGNMAGNALVTSRPDGTYSGPLWLFDRAGNTIDSGTVTVTFP